jgi:hypothetical protein
MRFLFSGWTLRWCRLVRSALPCGAEPFSSSAAKALVSVKVADFAYESEAFFYGSTKSGTTVRVKSAFVGLEAVRRGSCGDGLEEVVVA